MDVRVLVPASSANLGPGYDSFALGLGLYNEIDAELAEEWTVDVRGEGAGRLATGADNEIARAAARLFAEVGRPHLAARIACRNDIPVGRGLGSSAAAIVGGLVLADRLADAALGKERLLELATELEGHADNVAAALYGGFTVSVGGRMGARVQPARGVAAIVVVGERELPTALSRGALPATVPHRDAAENAGRASLLALGMALGESEYVRRGLLDAIHERYRQPLVPDMEEVRECLAAVGAGPAVLSGAGPTMLALVQDDDDAAALRRASHLAEQAQPGLGKLGRPLVLALPLDRAGACVL